VSDDETNSSKSKSSDLRDVLKQLAAPVLESLDGRLRDQVDARVDERIDDQITNRLVSLERAVADLDAELKKLRERVADESD